MLIALFGCLIALQDTHQVHPLRAAIERAASAASLRIEGAAETRSTLEEVARQYEDDPEMGRWIRRFGAGVMGPNGYFHGTVSASGDGALVFESESGMLEVYRRGSRTVQRRTTVIERSEEGEDGAERFFGGMRGPQPPGREAERILSLAWFRDHFGELLNLTETAREEVDGRSCRVFAANAPEELLGPRPQRTQPGGEGEGRGPGRQFRMFRGFGGPGMGGPLQEIRCTFWVDAQSGDLRKYRVDISYGEPPWVEQARQFADIPDDVRTTTSYEIEIHEARSDGVTYPEDIRRLLGA